LTHLGSQLATIRFGKCGATGFLLLGVAGWVAAGMLGAAAWCGHPPQKDAYPMALHLPLQKS